MADYSYKELMKMQNDAIRRAEDMQKRARQSAGLDRDERQNNRHSVNQKEEPRRIPMPNDYLDSLKKYASDSFEKECETEAEREDKSSEKNDSQDRSYNKNGTQPKLHNDFEDKIKSMFGDLKIDSDKALLLSLILLLSEEKADEVLIMALIYMLT